MATINVKGTNAHATTTTSVNNTSLTLASNATALLAIVGVSWSSCPGLAVSWDATGTPQPMTMIGELVVSTTSSMAFFGLVNPTTGNRTLRATWTDSLSVDLNAVSFIDTATIFADCFKNWAHPTPPVGTSGQLTITGTGGSNIMTAAGVDISAAWSGCSATGSSSWYQVSTAEALIAATAPSASPSLVWTFTCGSSITMGLAGVEVCSSTSVAWSAQTEDDGSALITAAPNANCLAEVFSWTTSG